MSEAIKGPNCTDPNLCKGDCCSIKIDVPKILAREYIRRSLADQEDFTRSNIYSLQLRFDEKTGKCFLFDRKINGCKVHSSGIKPPQCWIYPTNFCNQNKIQISCKKLPGWKIINATKAIKAEKLLKYYDFLCQIEARTEKTKIIERLGNSISIENNKLTHSLKKIAPCNIAGFQDKWNSIDILPAEGISLQLKKFCLLHHPKCQLLPDQFLDCKSVCRIITEKLIEFLKSKLPEYVKKRGVGQDGHYPLYLLFKNGEVF